MTAYTDDDLRAEAVRQHSAATVDLDFVNIGEATQDILIDSTVTGDGTGTTWNELPEDEFDTAVRAINDLITAAADVSEWAVDLGADHLEPSADSITATGTAADGSSRPLVRVHFAFTPDMPEDERDDFARRVGAALGAAESGAAS